MAGNPSRARKTGDYRRTLADRVREEASVIEADIVERIRLLEKESPAPAGWHPNGARKLVGVILEYVFRAIEDKDDLHPPSEAIAHARELAWKGCRTHDVVLGYRDCEGVFREHLRQADSSIKLRSQAGYADAERSLERALKPLLQAVVREHENEGRRLKSSPAARQLEKIKQLLSGERIPPPDLGYDLSATHIGLVGSGAGAKEEIQRLARDLGGQTLVVEASPGRVWAWIGLKVPSSAQRLDDALTGDRTDAGRLAIGEPASGFTGWCCTHKQARAAFALTYTAPLPVVRYGDVLVLACISRDDLLRDSLQRQFLDPLEHERDKGADLISTVETYLAKNRQLSSTAEALGVDRRTVRSRLDKVEARLGKTISAASFELQAALLLRSYGVYTDAGAGQSLTGSAR